MTDDFARIAAQLANEIIAQQLANELSNTLASPLSFLGLDLVQFVDERITGRSQMLAAQILDEDRKLAGQTVQDVMIALWSTEEPPPLWWSSPLGRACLESLDPGMRITQQEAAELLGVTRGTIAQLVARGTIDGNGEGVLLRDVLDRLARQAL